jgi:hypothetical protein
MRKIILTHRRAPGDLTVLTALVRDIALTYPGQFAIDVNCFSPELWEHNPYITPLRGVYRRDVEHINISYGQGLIDQVRETVHFLSYFHRDFEKQTNIAVPLCRPYPDLHLTDDELNNRIVEGRYWLIINGGKSDLTAKVWDCRKMQQVVNCLRQCGLGVVQDGGNKPGHWHMPLTGVLNLCGQTGLRDALRIIAQADGVICPVTFFMHAAAALHRPCIVLAGGREAWWWEAYVRQNIGLGGAELAQTLPMPHRYLHTIGMFDCCPYTGCWRNKVVEIDQDKSLCFRPVMYPEQPVPQCLDAITVDHVMEAVMSYYEDKSLPPISQSPVPAAEAIRRISSLADQAPLPAPAAIPRTQTGASLTGPRHQGPVACRPNPAVMAPARQPTVLRLAQPVIPVVLR